jgi:arylsulfatase
MFGGRAIYHEGWMASTTPPASPWLMGLGKMPDVIDGYKWELYDLTKDYSQFNDLAATEPDRLRDLQQLFLIEAANNQVLPLDNSVAQRLASPRPSATAGRDEFVYSGQISGLPAGSAPSIMGRSYTITAEVEVPDGGGDGMLATLGGRFGGYGLYLLKGKPVFTTTSWRWSVSGGRARKRCLPASIQSSSTSPTTAAAPARVARVC